MGNNLNISPVNSNINLVTNSVTKTLFNTHCIACGKVFPIERAGKLYCSPRCKQFGYNHKAILAKALDNREQGINPKSHSFLIDDYNQYNRTQKRLSRFHILSSKQRDWQAANQELILRDKYALQLRNHTLDTYTNHKLTEEEDNELYDIEADLDEEILSLNLRELSIEQWSFIKSLYPNLNELSLIQIIASFSKSFFGELNLLYNADEKPSEFLVIKNKFVNHCNLIVDGIITFSSKS